MRALIQRVSKGSVAVGERVVGSIGPGLVVLVGISRDDDEEDVRYLVGKTVNLRIFADAEGRFNLSALETRAELLLVSQFTLYADTRRGRRPGFTSAAPPEKAGPLFECTVEMFRETGLAVEAGLFQAHMVVSLENDGPFTIMLDSADRERPRRS